MIVSISAYVRLKSACIKNKLVKNSTEGDIAPALGEMTTACNVGEAKPGHGACMKSLSRTNTRPEQNIYKVLITCFRELLLKGQVLTTSLNSKVHRGGRVVRWFWVNFQCRGILEFGL